jgi:hypothetical protein
VIEIMLIFWIIVKLWEFCEVFGKFVAIVPTLFCVGLDIAVGSRAGFFELNFWWDSDL